MWETHEEYTDAISYLTANTLPLNYAENLLMLHMGTIAVYSENNRIDTNRRVLCAVFLCGAASDATFYGRCVCVSVRGCVRSTSEFFAVCHKTTVRC
jgi:hypothetical protein